nr:hypothetical protein [uncultured Rhodoferax sp.]
MTIAPITRLPPALLSATHGAGDGTEPAWAAGIDNLLTHCAGSSANQNLLVVVEPDETFYKGQLGQKLAHDARQRGLNVQVVAAPLVTGPEKFPLDLLELIAQADHTVFFSRLGTMGRFLKFPGVGTKIVCYTLDPTSLASSFATLPYAFLQAVHDALVRKISASSSYRITCANGTNLHAELRKGITPDLPVLTPFTVRNFPLMVVPPISAQTLNGTLALSLALLSTATHNYPDPILPLNGPLLLSIEQGRISGFGGETAQALRAQQHFDRVAKDVNGDPRCVNSWHTGFNPGTWFAGQAKDDLLRWGNVIFGSPRYTHFHMVGSDPGDICGSLFDATISFDCEVLWRDGQLVFLHTEEGQALATEHGVSLESIEASPSIGI